MTSHSSVDIIFLITIVLLDVMILLVIVGMAHALWLELRGDSDD
jgi:hypothetical protein